MNGSRTRKQVEMIDEELLALCRSVAEEMLQNQGWSLASEWVVGKQQVSDLFVSQVAEAASRRLTGVKSGGAAKQAIRSAVLNQYSHLLYQACLLPGSERAETAYAELWNHLYDIAHYKLGRDRVAAEECAQTAMLNLVRQFRKSPQGFMRDAGAFLSYAYKSLLPAIRAHWSQQEEDIISIDVDEKDDDRQPLQIPDSRERVNGALIQEASRQEIEMALQACLTSEQQRRVISGLFLDGLSVWDLSIKMGRSPENIWVLKSRALSRLKKCVPLYQALITAIQEGGSQGG